MVVSRVPRDFPKSVRWLVGPVGFLRGRCEMAKPGISLEYEMERRIGRAAVRLCAPAERLRHSWFLDIRRRGNRPSGAAISVHCCAGNGAVWFTRALGGRDRRPRLPAANLECGALVHLPRRAPTGASGCLV